MHRRTAILGGLAAAVLGGTVVARQGYRRDLAAARARIARDSTTISTAFGTMEYGTSGPAAGPPIVMIHGTGGGFDQGLTAAEPLAAAGYRIIAPSRFGYLRSDLPDDPSSAQQAAAIVTLLDHLGVARAAIVGISAGARSALALALDHPGRCTGLVPVVPATAIPGVAPPMPGAIGQAIMEYSLNSDLVFWAGVRFAKRQMIGTLLATDPAVYDRASAAEQARADRLLTEILPVSARSAGLMNDARLSLQPEVMPLVRITVPTLAISLQDDRFDTYAAATHIAETVPGARLLWFETGGHVFLDQADAIYGEIDRFLQGLSST